MYKLESINTEYLNKELILKICKLKDSQWKFGIQSQLKYFKKSIKPKDIHNCFFFKKSLIGYTLLKKRTIIFKKKKIKYILFDTLVIKKNLRKKKLSSIMMIFNNNTIKNEKLISFLICKNELINFYKKYSWKIVNSRKIQIVDHIFKTNLMFFNYVDSKKNNLKFNKNLIKIFTKK